MTHRSRLSIGLTFCIGCIVLAATPARAVIKYSVTDLGSLGNSTNDTTQPLDISNSGYVTGVGYFGPGFNHMAFRWSNGSIQNIGALPGHSFSEGFGVNDAGVVVGNSAAFGGDPTHAFRWTNGSMVDLGTLGGPYSYAYAINTSGQVAGSASVTAGPSHATLWSASGTPTDLGLLPGVTSGISLALAMNDAGVVVGHGTSTGTSDHAFRFFAGSMQDLGVLPGGSDSWVRGVNNSGLIVGHSTTASTLRGFAWAGAGLIPLNPVGTDNACAALGVNSLGEIVGDTEPFAYNNGHAAYWQNYSSNPIDLNTVIDPLAGWTLIRCRGINDSGWIVGEGSLAGIGGTRAFLLKPLPVIPEPAAALCILLLPWLQILRRRRNLGPMVAF